MKFSTIILLLLLFSACRSQPYYEGKISYKLSFSPENTRIDTFLLKDFYGDQWTFFFSEGNFKWDMGSSNTWSWYNYERNSNKFFYFSKDADVVAWKKGSTVTDSIINMVGIDTSVAILGKNCKVLRVAGKFLSNGKLRTRSYYYSPDLSVNPVWFSEIEDGNMNEVYKNIKAIPLKIADDFGTFTITYEATEILPRNLPASVFEIKGARFVEI